MTATASAPLLSRIKSWQLICLGISGWITIYSAAIISWGASSFVVGNTQGGCFATVMTLAGVEVRRFKKRTATPVDSLQWTGGISTKELNQTLVYSLVMKMMRVEIPHPTEAAMGFGLRAVNAGRTMLFETARWKEPVIDLLHAQTTEQNRNKLHADLAVIVGAGIPDEDTKLFVKTHPLKLLTGNELKDLFAEKRPLASNLEAKPTIVSKENSPLSPENNV